MGVWPWLTISFIILIFLISILSFRWMIPTTGIPSASSINTSKEYHCHTPHTDHNTFVKPNTKMFFNYRQKLASAWNKTEKFKYHKINLKAAVLLLLIIPTTVTAGEQSRSGHFKQPKIAGVNSPDTWTSWLAKKLVREAATSATNDLRHKMNQFKPSMNTPSSPAANLSSPTILIMAVSALLWLLINSEPNSKNPAPPDPPLSPKDKRKTPPLPPVQPKTQGRHRTRSSSTWAHSVSLIMAAILLTPTMAEVRTKIPIEQSLLLIRQGGACKELAGITAYTVLDEDTGENYDELVDWSHLKWEAQISLKICEKEFELDITNIFGPDGVLYDGASYTGNLKHSGHSYLPLVLILTCMYAAAITFCCICLACHLAAKGCKECKTAKPNRAIGYKTLLTLTVFMIFVSPATACSPRTITKPSPVITALAALSMWTPQGVEAG